jgi:hypothetical protein
LILSELISQTFVFAQIISLENCVSLTSILANGGILNILRELRVAQVVIWIVVDYFRGRRHGHHTLLALVA